MSRLKDVYADSSHNHCKFAGTELLDRQGYYSPLMLILTAKLDDDGVPHRTEYDFSKRAETERNVIEHLEKFFHPIQPTLELEL